MRIDPILKLLRYPYGFHLILRNNTDLDLKELPKIVVSSLLGSNFNIKGASTPFYDSNYMSHLIIIVHDISIMRS